MKTKLILTLMMAIAFLFSNCSSDSDNNSEPAAKPNFTYQGGNYYAKTAGYADYGVSTDSVHTYKRVDFYLSNATWNGNASSFSGANWYLIVRTNLAPTTDIATQRITYTKEKNHYDELINKAGNLTYAMFIKKAVIDNEGDLDLSQSDYIVLNDADNLVFDIAKNGEEYSIKVGGTIGENFVDGTFTGELNPY